VTSPYGFSFEPLFLALGLVAAVAYARARPRGWRVWAFAAGLALVVVPVNSPLETIAVKRLLLMHLLQNVMIADWAPLLLILGLTSAMRARIAPPVELLTRPRVALPLWLAAWYGTHAAAFYDYALRHPWALNLEHLVLLLAGLAFWWPVLTGRLSTPGAIAYLGVAFVSSAFLGLALTFSTSVFYDYYAAAPRLWGLSASKDQNLGGILMNAEQTLVFLAALGFFLMRLLDEEAERGA
jgi:cytochrome c oxidase assembly factor CtaG